MRQCETTAHRAFRQCKNPAVAVVTIREPFGGDILACPAHLRCWRRNNRYISDRPLEATTTALEER